MNLYVFKDNSIEKGKLMKTLLLKITLFVLLILLVTACQDKPSNTTKKIIATENSPAAFGPFSQGNVAGGLLFTSGQLPIHPKTGVVPETIEEQTKQVLENLKAIIIASGSRMDQVVRCTVYLQDFKDFATMNKIYATYFPENPPARVAVEVSKMAKDALVEIDAIAIVN